MTRIAAQKLFSEREDHLPSLPDHDQAAQSLLPRAVAFRPRQVLDPTAPVPETKKSPRPQWEKTRSNWGGNQKIDPQQIRVIDPLSNPEQQIQAVFDEAKRCGLTVRVVGSSHSFSALVDSKDIIVDLRKLKGFVDTRYKSSTTVWAGTSIHELNRLLDQRGLALETMGDIDKQSVAGAIATGTHGTGLNYTSLSNLVEEFTIVSPDRGILVCNENSQPELFRLGRLSLGVLGVITRVRFKTQPAFNLKKRIETVSLDEALQKFPAVAQAHDHAELFIHPYSRKNGKKQVQIVTLDEMQPGEPIKPLAKSKAKQIDFEENEVFAFFVGLTRLFPKSAKGISRLIQTLQSGKTVEYSDKSYKVFVSDRRVRFVEMEFAVPFEKGPAALREILQMIEEQKINDPFPLEYRTLRGGDGSGFNYAGNFVTISIHIAKGKNRERARFFGGAEKVFRKYGGHPHLGKANSFTAEELRHINPAGWDDFQKMRLQLDAKGILLNKYLQKIFLSE